MSANETRGEIALKLDGVDYVLRPSYEAIGAFETQTGKGLLELARQSGEAGLTLAECSAIVAECIKAAGRAKNDQAMANVNARRIGELIMESDGGLLLAMKRLEILLFMAATGGYTGSGEEKATTTG